jgi:hypothetical protein
LIKTHTPIFGVPIGIIFHSCPSSFRQTRSGLRGLRTRTSGFDLFGRGTIAGLRRHDEGILNGQKSSGAAHRSTRKPALSHAQQWRMVFATEINID